MGHSQLKEGLGGHFIVCLVYIHFLNVKSFNVMNTVSAL